MPRLRLDLRAQLALQVAIGLASVVILVLLLRAYLLQEEVDRAARGRLAVGQVLANYVDAKLGDQLQQLARGAARLQSAGAGGSATVVEDLRSRLDATVYGVYLLDGHGNVVAADPPAVGDVGRTIARRPDVADSLTQGRAVVSGVHAGPGGRAQVGVVVPVRLAWLATDSDPGRAQGAIGLAFDPTNPRFGELVESARSLGGDTTAEVVDQAGLVVASSQRERTLLPGRYPVLNREWARSREPGTALVLPMGEGTADRHLVAMLPLRLAAWALLLGGPESEVLAPLQRWDPPLVALALASLSVLIVLATLTARSVINPVRALIIAAHRIARGDFDSEVPRAGGGELRQLATTLDDMRQDLRSARDARDDVDRLKDEFVSSISHELRTPLGYIKGYTTTLLRTDADWDADTQREFLGIIDQSSDQLEELVDHLLDISRISEGRLAVEPEQLRIEVLADEVARRASGRVAGHAIEVAIPESLPMVLADRDRIGQVLGNLIDNAIKYSPDGGRITITAVASGEEVVVAVRDEGIGIPQELLATVFDRFQRGNHPRVRTIRGTGLGLPICRGIVEAHGGRIWAERAPDRGTIVRFTLPVAVSEAERVDDLAALMSEIGTDRARAGDDTPVDRAVG